MRTRFIAFGFLFAGLFVVVTSIFNKVQSNAGGAPSGRTGSPKDGTSCISCHSPATNFNGAASITTNIPATGYIAGQTYTVTASLTRTGHTRWGFEVSPQDTTVAHNFIGTLVVTNSTTTKLVNTNYITQTTAGTTGGTDAISWSFNWKAPVTGKGPAIFYGALNATNNKNNDTGDSIFLTNTKVYECIPPAKPGAITGTTTVCAGSQATYSVTPVSGATSYDWTLPSGWTGSSTTNSITATAGSTGGTISVTATNVCGASAATTAALTVTTPTVVTVSITIPKDTICSGTFANFLATPASGGTYQWKLNNGNVGTGLNTYSNSALVTGDKVNCVFTSSGTCVTSNPATSNTITMVVNPVVVPTVSITASKDTVCSGTQVTFTAAPGNAGTYQWKLNNGNVGTGQATYSNSALANGDKVSCVLTSNAACANPLTATSNTKTMTVNPILTTSVAITASEDTICNGTSVDFNANAVNAGTGPTYQWKLNSGNVGLNQATYSNAGLASGDKITCVVTSNALCPSPNPATSNQITMVVNPVLTPSVSITASKDTICNGTSVTFTATPGSGITASSYQWKLNNGNVGTGLSTYSNAALADGDKISCVLTSNANCLTQNTATSNTVTMKVNPALATSIAISPTTDTICSGATVNFTANIGNGGTAPVYQWKLNNGNVGTNLPTYSNGALANSDKVSCVLTSNALCATPNPATSNTISMTVNPVLVPALTITASEDTICSGSNVDFTVTPVNGGLAPAYQWKLNNSNVATGSAYSNNALATGDKISCVLTSNATCVAPTTATSNTIIMTVNPQVTPSVSIVATKDTICDGTSVIFTATAINGGTAPAYQWKLNNANVGTGLTTYSNSALVNGDKVSCVLTSNANCQTTNAATSNTVTITVNPVLNVSITITPTEDTICNGTNVDFTASTVNEGSSPVYQWKLNGGSVGVNYPLYSNAGLTNNDKVTCLLTSDATCATPNPATSNQVTMVVNPLLTPSVTVSSNSGTSICLHQKVIFSAQPVNGGSNPVYQWKKNGVNVNGETSVTYRDSTIAEGDSVNVVLTSNATCATPTGVVSRALLMHIVENASPSVTIQSNKRDSVCAGQSVTFTADVLNGGTAPTYQWIKNGQVLTGDTLSAYTTSVLSEGDSISVNIISNSACVVTALASSNGIVMHVTNNVTPAISISPVTSGTACQGQPVSFTSTSANQGSSPGYRWIKNGIDLTGETLPTFVSSGLADGDVIRLRLTSSLQCVVTPTATSDTIKVHIISNVTPAVSIQPDTVTSACQGQTVNFTSNVTNGGSLPLYQWVKNGQDINGETSSAYSSATLANGDTISVNVTSNFACLVTPFASSNKTLVNIITNVSPAVSILPDTAISVCQGVPVHFTSVATNGGTLPAYQWIKNGVNIGGENNSDYTSSSLADGDTISLHITSNFTCLLSSEAVSNSTVVNVSPGVTPTISITADPATTICTGQTVHFTSSVTNEGTTPVYQWLKNGTPVNGEDSASYTSSSLVDGDLVSCLLTSDVRCATPGTVSSQSDMVHTYSPPNANITFTHDTLFASQAVSYQWKLNDTLINGATLPLLVPAVKGNYQVEVTDVHGCTNSSDKFNVEVLLTIETTIPANLLVYPNPTEGIVVIDYGQGNNSPADMVRVYDLNGHLLIENRIVEPQGQKIKVDMKMLDSGIYFLCIQSNDRVYNARIIKQ